MKKLTAIVAILCAFTFSACNADAAKTAKAAEPTTEDQKTLYALGIFMSQQVDVFALTPEELVMVQKGLADGVAHNKPAVDIETYKPKLQTLAQSRIEAASKKSAEAGTAYVEKASKEAGATKTASGMIIKHTKEGTGAQPAATDQVKVHYEGRLIDGKVFDSSIARGEPATFPLNGVIPCWTEGVQTMKVGGKAQFVCPASLAYGPNGSPPTIPPQSTLVFDVELLDIVKPQ
jgi:FKBP-type peptidyl-prolyl cis-trans isomerase FkpA